MPKDDRDVLEVLRFELSFLEKGGYGRSPRERWRAPLIFEDSPTCMNYDQKDHPDPCGDCLLMRFVPPHARGERIPCSHIPLNDNGETLSTLYRWGDQAEIEQAMKGWLQATIQRLEKERADLQVAGSATRPVPGRGIR